jgi:hypothetical protein
LYKYLLCDFKLNAAEAIAAVYTNASKATGYFLKEINYLLSKGYKVVESGCAMVKK